MGTEWHPPISPAWTPSLPPTASFHITQASLWGLGWSSEGGTGRIQNPDPTLGLNQRLLAPLSGILRQEWQRQVRFLRPESWALVGPGRWPSWGWWVGQRSGILFGSRPVV